MSVEITLDSTAIEPGGTISGRVTWPGAGSTLVVALGWVTRGKGDKDTDEVTATTIPVAGQTEARFTLTAPFQPFTFSGKLISIVYYVTAKVGIGEAKVEIVIAPGGKEVVLARP